MPTDQPNQPASTPAVPVLDYRSTSPVVAQTTITARTQILFGQAGASATVIGFLMLIAGVLLAVSGFMLVANVSLEAGIIIVAIGFATAGPSVYLLRCGRYTREFLRTLDGEALEKSLEASMKFWKVLPLAILGVAGVAILMAMAGMIRF